MAWLCLITKGLCSCQATLSLHTSLCFQVLANNIHCSYLGEIRGHVTLPLLAHRVLHNLLLFSITCTHLFKWIVLKHFSKNSVPIWHQLPAQTPTHCWIKEIIAQKVSHVGNGHHSAGRFLSMAHKIFKVWGIAFPCITFYTFGYFDPFSHY